VRACSAAGATAVTDLLRKGADCNAESRHGRLPLVRAASSGNVEAILTLLTAGARIDALDAHGSGGSALLAACMAGHLSVVELLCAHGACRAAHKCGTWGPLDLEATMEKELQELREMQHNQTADAVEVVLHWLQAHPTTGGPDQESPPTGSS